MKVDLSAILNAKILIVDDLISHISLLGQVLRRVGYVRVSSTMIPQEVCALHRSNNYDLILLDLQMPGMDGFEVMEGLKTNCADDFLPVIVLTALPGHNVRALQAGARDFIDKPFDLVEVETRIRNMLEVRLLYRALDNFNTELEKLVLERTAELRQSEARYRSLTELATDWYWEQDQNGNFTQIAGPVLEMLGVGAGGLTAEAGADGANGWNEARREALRAMIADRQLFVDFALSRVKADGSQQTIVVSGEPIVDDLCRYVGYRGFGVEYSPKN